MDLLTKAISYISPSWAFRRERNSLALKELSRAFDAAGRGRRTDSWHTTNSSANTENRMALFTLRNRSRELVRNNPFSRKAVNAMARNVVGNGIVPNIKNTNEKIQKATKKAWKEWAESKKCDFNERFNFYGLQRQVARAVAESGEVLILKRKVSTKVCPLGIQLQVLEADFLDIHKTVSQIDNGGYIMQGVEFDIKGKRVAYWLYEVHPGETALVPPMKAYVSKRVPASEVIHVYDPERPGQERGLPLGTASMLRIRDFDEYEDAQLVRQKIAACFSVFVEDASADTIRGTNKPDDTKLNERVEPGIIEHLPAGKKVSFASPPTTTGYDEYSRKMLQGVAAGYDTSYEVLTGDLKNVNFSSGRMGWLEYQRTISDWQQNIIIPTMCEDVWQWFATNISLAFGIKTKETEVSWTPPRREMIDPVKETTGITNRVRAGLMTPSEAAREQGYEFEEMMIEYSRDLKTLDKFGIKLDTDIRNELQETVQPPSEGPKG